MKVKCQVVASSFLLFAALSAAGASLREAYAPHFNVGVALGRNEVADPASRALAARGALRPRRNFAVTQMDY